MGDDFFTYGVLQQITPFCRYMSCVDMNCGFGELPSSNAINRNPDCFVKQVADDVIDAHNIIRADLGSQPGLWDESLAQLAHAEVMLHLQ
jgi:hypothetical protein